MLVIKVWCLPGDTTQEKLESLFWDMVHVVTEIKELGVKDEHDMLALYPPDKMIFGLGSEILVEISGLLERPERTAKVRSRLARKVGEVVKSHFPDAYVEASVQTCVFGHGFWTSSERN